MGGFDFSIFGGSKSRFWVPEMRSWGLKSAVVRNEICGGWRGESYLIGFGDHEAGGALQEELRRVENPCVIRVEGDLYTAIGKTRKGSLLLVGCIA